MIMSTLKVPPPNTYKLGTDAAESNTDYSNSDRKSLSEFIYNWNKEKEAWVRKIWVEILS